MGRWGLLMAHAGSGSLADHSLPSSSDGACGPARVPLLLPPTTSLPLRDIGTASDTLEQNRAWALSSQHITDTRLIPSTEQYKGQGGMGVSCTHPCPVPTKCRGTPDALWTQARVASDHVTAAKGPAAVLAGLRTTTSHHQCQLEPSELDASSAADGWPIVTRSLSLHYPTYLTHPRPCLESCRLLAFTT